MSETSNKIAQYLTENPRWIGVLFAAFMLLNSTTPVAAELGSCVSGP